MGIFLELIEETKSTTRNRQASTLEARVNSLEKELAETKDLLHKLVILLEKEYNRDIDGDGKIG